MGIVGPVVRRVLALHLDSGGDRLPGSRKRKEERVALGVDLDSVRTERVADDPAMLGEHVAVAVPELSEQRGRFLDVGEDERHRPAGQ